LLRFFRKDLLNQRIDNSSTSYWIRKQEKVFSKSHYEQMG
jgi:hypothetical protein